MPEYIVKYKLEKFGNGYITPAIIHDGGYVWSNENKIEDMVLVGKANYLVTEGTPDGIIERITQQQWDAHKLSKAEESIKVYKAKKYAEITDPLFMEAYRERKQGRKTKWNDYLKKCKKIYTLKEIPEGDI